MTVKEVYEKVCILMPVEQRLFFHRLNDTIYELMALYPKKKILKDNKTWEPIKTLEGELSIRELYIPGIIDNIIFLSGGNENLKSEFIRKSGNAAKQYNSSNAEFKIIKRTGW